MNPFIWASWGYLEYLTGNVSRARKLFDAATVVDETHSAAWHKWGMLEMKQGNYLRARCAAEQAAAGAARNKWLSVVLLTHTRMRCGIVCISAVMPCVSAYAMRSKCSQSSIPAWACSLLCLMSCLCVAGICGPKAYRSVVDHLASQTHTCIAH